MDRMLVSSNARNISCADFVFDRIRLVSIKAGMNTGHLTPTLSPVPRDTMIFHEQVLRIYAYMDHNFHVASIPSFRLAMHLRRLVDAGYKARIQTATSIPI